MELLQGPLRAAAAAPPFAVGYVLTHVNGERLKLKEDALADKVARALKGGGMALADLNKMLAETTWPLKLTFVPKAMAEGKKTAAQIQDMTNKAGQVAKQLAKHGDEVEDAAQGVKTAVRAIAEAID